MILRTSAEADRYANTVALPGGKPEKDEPPLSTCIRETIEEVGIDLQTNSFRYLGKFPTNFPFFYMSKKRRLYIQPFVFLQLDQ